MNWLSTVGQLLARRSRTAWAAVGVIAAAVIPPLLANWSAVQDLAAALNAPAWVRPTVTLVGTVAGALWALHARVDDQQTGANPQ